jgi:protein-disulfide isomerase
MNEKNKLKIIENKQSFFLGLSAGVILASLVMLAFVFGGGDLPAEKQAGTDSQLKSQSKTTNQLNKKAEVKVTDDDHFRGNKNAPVVIVEFSDIQCSYCSRFHQSMKQLVANYPNDIKWVFKHFPLDAMHPFARKAAEATECASDQGKFWELLDKYYDNQGQLSEAYIKQAAKEVGLEEKAFNDCFDHGKYAKKVEENFAYGKTLGVRGTPGNFLNGIAVSGAVPYADLESMLAEELSK